MGKPVTLFANTGVQRVQTDIDVGESEQREWVALCNEIGWVKYRTVNGKIWLLIDTSTGPVDRLFFAESESRIQKPGPKLKFDWIPDKPEIQLDIRASKDGTGDPKGVAFVLDFGNCRSTGLLVEDPSGDAQKLAARPFRLKAHRPVEQEGQDADIGEHTFSSHFEFISDYIERTSTTVTRETKPVIEEQPAKGFLGRLKGKKETIIQPPEIVQQQVDTGLFSDISPVRLGHEGDDFRRKISAHDGVLTGMSSPKRYLWADELIENNFWHQIHSAELPNGQFFQSVNGGFFEYIYEDDSDWDALPIHDTDHRPPRNPDRPRYPRRAMMTFCIYELLCQAYEQINSEKYREESDEPFRKRILTDLVLSCPSGMCAKERERYALQVEKALKIFTHHNVPEGQNPPRLRLVTDEGTAGQLAYVYGELSSFGSAENWLRVVGREDDSTGLAKVRIACLDIGGGTTDLTIADYCDRAPGPATDLLCETKHIDGIAKAGDELVLAVLQKIILPRVAEELNLGRRAAKVLFESVDDGAFNAEKRRWMTDIWIPAAHEYLRLAEAENTVDDFQLVSACNDALLLESMQESIERFTGLSITDPGDITFQYDREATKAVVKKALAKPLWQMASVISSFDCDLVLLAGRTSKLPLVEELVRTFLSTPESRIVALSGYPTGAWYPVQDPGDPGKIADPKSVVCVGSAIEYLCSGRKGLGHMRLEFKNGISACKSYFWGPGTSEKRRFANDEAFFWPQDDKEEETVRIVGTEQLIGRRLSGDDEDEIAPIYSIRIVRDYDEGAIDVVLRRKRAETIDDDEELELVDVSGYVGVIDENGNQVREPAEMDKNVIMKLRTMFEERYFLDTEAVFDIDYTQLTNP